MDIAKIQQNAYILYKGFQEDIMISAIVAAAGKGSRMNAEINKQFIDLQGKAIVLRTIEKLAGDYLIDEIVVVIVKEEEDIYNEKVKPYIKTDKKIKLAYGGKERIDSVKNGLVLVDESSDIVIIHDGVRPFFTHEDIKAVIEGTTQYDGCITGVRVKDTIKTVDKDGYVINTPRREALFAVHTPQAFKKKALINAYENYEKNFSDNIPTDDASLIEYNGGRVKTVIGSYDNIKITTPQDLIFANAILEKYEEGSK